MIFGIMKKISKFDLEEKIGKDKSEHQGEKK